MEKAMYQQLDSETQEKVETIFLEIQEKSNAIFLQGLRNITSTNLKELKDFELRLLDLGLEYLATEFNKFGKSAQSIIDPQKSQGLGSEEQIELLVHIFIRITSYLRVFERVKTKNLNLKNLHEEISKVMHTEDISIHQDEEE